jgi:lipopolysaccharide transport system permease protein
VWVFLTNQGVIQLEDAGVPYPLFVLAGTTCWQIFVQSLLMPTQIVNANKSILTKINFPRQAILVAGLVELLVPLMAGLIILAATMGIMGQAPGFWLIPGVVLLLIFVLGGFFIGLFLLPIGILFKDVQYGLPAIMQMLMYLTPVVYPKPDYQGFARVLDYNPVTPVITAARAWIINMPEKPGWEVLLIATGVIFMLGYVGLVLYRVTLSVLIERMGT